MQKDVRRIYKNLLMDCLKNSDKWFYETTTHETLDSFYEYHYFSYSNDNIKISISRGLNIVTIYIIKTIGVVNSVSFLSCINFWFEPELGRLYRQMKKVVKTEIKNKEFNELIASLPNSSRSIKVHKILNNIKNGK